MNQDEKMEWISVKDRLPEGVTQCIMNSYVKDAIRENVVICGAFISNRFYNLEDLNEYETPEPLEDDRITHWMPLPEPPPN